MDVLPTRGRDLAVLTAIYVRLQNARAVDMDELVTDTGLDSDTIDQIVRLWLKDGALDNTALLTSGDPDELQIGRESLTPRGNRLVGAWPSPETIAEEIVQALQEVADREEDPERQRSLKDLVKQMRPGHVVDLARAIQVLMETGVLPDIG